MAHNGQAASLEFLTSSPEMQPTKINDDEVKNKSSIEFGRPEPLLIANKKDEDLFVSRHSRKPNVGG
jgi:hypothetical protein